jgi:hypothetical protein
MSQDRSLMIFAGVGCAAFAGLTLCAVSGGVLFFLARSRAAEPAPVSAWNEPVEVPRNEPVEVPLEGTSEPTVIQYEYLTIAATVNSFSGSSTVAAGSTCNFSVEHRVFSNNTAQCHVDVVCGDNEHLYGTAVNGFFRCEFSRVPARVVGQDLETTSGDTDGAFVIDTDRHVLEVRDDASGIFGAFEMRATITSVL